MADLVAMGGCASCGHVFAFCPECVSVLIIDPTTGRLADIDANGHKFEPGPDVMARSVARPVCVSCIDAFNAKLTPDMRIETELARHARHLGHPDIRATA